MPENKILFRLAVRIYQAIHANHVNAPYQELAGCVTRLRSRWQDLDRGLHLVSAALGKDWRAAARDQINSSRFALEDIQHYMRELSEAADKANRPPLSYCSVPTIHADLLDLQQEFAEFRWDKHDIWVRTRPITL